MGDNEWLASLDVDDDDKEGIYSAYLDYCCMIADDYPWPSPKSWWDEVGKECYEEDRRV